MSNDIECPYCGKEQDINHDDGNGSCEATTYKHQCTECEKVFAFDVHISHSYTSYVANCLNGGNHEFNKFGWCNCGEKQ